MPESPLNTMSFCQDESLNQLPMWISGYQEYLCSECVLLTLIGNEESNSTSLQALIFVFFKQYCNQNMNCLFTTGCSASK